MSRGLKTYFSILSVHAEVTFLEYFLDSLSMFLLFQLLTLDASHIICFILILRDA